MPFDPLATTVDLSDRGITGDATELAAFLDAASAAVRDAAGVPISRETFTATVPGQRDQWLPLPGVPVVEVTSAAIDDDAVEDWRLIGARLWRRHGWQASACTPSNVTIALTGGLEPVPADIVDLVCAMVGNATNEGDGGYASRGDLAGFRVDDYSEQYVTAAGERLAGPMELPPRTRERLAARFGGGAYVIRTGA